MKKVSLIEKAARIAAVVHKEQVRKDEDSPYIVHPFMVALKVAQHGFGDTAIAAALVHDTLEDSDTSEKQIEQELGKDVLDIVKSVSDNSTLQWEERKKGYIESVRNGSEDAKAVSIADKIHNIEGLLAAYDFEGPELWNKFTRGKEQQIWFAQEMLTMFKETWEHPLVDEYKLLVDRFETLD